MRIRRFVQAALVLSALAFGGSASAEPAKDFAKTKQDDITAMLKRNASDADVNNALSSIIDYHALVKRCFGPHWEELNDAQKSEVKTLMKQLVEKNYQKNLKKTLKYKTEVKSDKVVGNETRVHIKASDNESSHAPPVNIEYVMRQDGGSWKVVDIVTEGSSLTHNYYSQIHKMMTNKDQGYTYVVQKLKEKVAKA
jgi:ABC-type transporter MlaC component